jgi:hypothetical protein
MKKLKLLALLAVALLIMAPAFADDFGFSSFGDESVSPSDSSSDDSSSFGSFDTDVFGGGESSDDSNSLQITGTAGLTSRVYLQDKNSVIATGEDFVAGETYCTPSLKLDLSYSNTNSDLTGSILLTNDTVSSYPEDIINEITYRAYVDNFVLEAGKTKIVWGRGDKIHVLDLINANDLSNFLIPDYIDRRIAEPEMDVTWNIPSEKNLSLQLIFTPGMSVDRLDTTGRWTPDAVALIKSNITSYATKNMLSAYTTAYDYYISNGSTVATAGAAATSAELLAAETYTDEDSYYANTHTLEYAQYGARLTGTIGTVDWGTEYYFGHYKTPSVKDLDSNINLDYDQLQVFGVDAETVKGAYSIRGELAYYLTEDIEGDDYSTHNNSLQWVAGFDRNLPWSNLNLNIQELGSYTLNYSKVQDNVSSVLPFDMDQNAADCASNNKIIVKLSNTLMHETLKPSVSVMYGIEGVDLVIMPEVSYIVKDGFEVTANANFVFSDDTTGEYAEYENNAELQLKAEYSF